MTTCGTHYGIHVIVQKLIHISVFQDGKLKPSCYFFDQIEPIGQISISVLRDLKSLLAIITVLREEMQKMPLFCGTAAFVT